MEPLISVIIPVYKVEKYLDRCVESVINQTYKKLEIILVDDGSPDNCPQMCDEWAKKDERIKVIHKENDGLANARNSGIDIASGEFVMFVDSDDWIENDMTEILVDTISNYDIARCGFVFDYSDESRTEYYYSNGDLIIADYSRAVSDLAYEGYAGISCCKLYRFDAIKNHRFLKEDGCSEDLMFNYRLIRSGVKIVYNNISKYHYVVRTNSITKSEFSKGAFDILKAKKFIIDCEMSNSELLPNCIRGYIRSLYIVIGGMIKNNMFMDEFDDIREEILKYKKTILSSDSYSSKTKIKTLLLCYFPKMFITFVKGNN